MASCRSPVLKRHVGGRELCDPVELLVVNYPRRLFVVPTVAASIDLVVQVSMEHDGSRHVREIVALPGRVEAGVVETADIFTTIDGKLVRAQGYPPHPDRFARAGYDLPGLLAGGPHGDRRRPTSGVNPPR